MLREEMPGRVQRRGAHQRSGGSSVSTTQTAQAGSLLQPFRLPPVLCHLAPDLIRISRWAQQMAFFPVSPSRWSFSPDWGQVWARRAFSTQPSWWAQSHGWVTPSWADSESSHSGGPRGSQGRNCRDRKHSAGSWSGGPLSPSTWTLLSLVGGVSQGRGGSCPLPPPPPAAVDAGWGVQAHTDQVAHQGPPAEASRLPTEAGAPGFTRSSGERLEEVSAICRAKGETQLCA